MRFQIQLKRWWTVLALLPNIFQKSTLAFILRDDVTHATRYSHRITRLGSSSTLQRKISVENHLCPQAESYTSEVEKTQKNECLFTALYQTINVGPEDLLRIEENECGVRGIYLNRHVQAGDVILRIPLSSCLRDDQPPYWFTRREPEVEGSVMPSDWATRLAASLIDAKLKPSCDVIQFHPSEHKGSKSRATDLWLSLLPESKFLRATLPVHWSTSLLQSARCTALELAVDSAFFARAQAVEDLMQALATALSADMFELNYRELRQECEDALDVIQTRSCRVMTETVRDWPNQPLRLVAPVFDFINHDGAPNARFSLENLDENFDSEKHLIVRLICDLEANTEVLIDYGDSARPAWKCLASYGFVPPYDESLEKAEDEDDDQQQEVAEVYMDGVRYEVGPNSIPHEMVAAIITTSQGGSRTLPEPVEEVKFTPDIAIRLARRISDAAFHLLTDPPIVEEDDDADDDNMYQSAEEILSARLAASLRWNQHRILMACSLGLRDWAVQANSRGQAT